MNSVVRRVVVRGVVQGVGYRAWVEREAIARDLEGWVRRIRDWDLPESWVYFDNDQAAYAVDNAQRMNAMIEGRA